MQTEQTKRCSKCREVKPFSSFYIDRRDKHNRPTSRCKPCVRAYSNAMTKIWRKNNPASKKRSEQKSKLKRTYGLSISDVCRQLEDQNGLCAICQNKISFDAVNKKDRPHIDHCHLVGHVRGILCLTCNTGLGMFKDSLDLLDKAKDYLLATGQRERLSELAPSGESVAEHPKGDAIVRSHGNRNHERLAEMSSPLDQVKE